MDRTINVPSGGVERTIAMLKLLALAEELLKLCDVAHQLDIPKSACHRILTSLIDNGWVWQSPESDCYALTMRMALVGQKQLARLQVSDLRQPILKALAGRTRELVRLTAVQKNEVGEAEEGLGAIAVAIRQGMVRRHHERCGAADTSHGRARGRDIAASGNGRERHGNRLVAERLFSAQMAA